jgi:hypothetical protein
LDLIDSVGLVAQLSQLLFEGVTTRRTVTGLDALK